MPAPDPPARAQSILLVDDEPDILDSLQTILERHLPGVKVRTALSGPQALDLLKAEPADLIVTDYKMPSMNGLDFLEEASRVAPGVPRILVTAFPDLDIALRAINQAGVEHFITKPFRPEEVVEQVRAALFKRKVDGLWRSSLQRQMKP